MKQEHIQMHTASATHVGRRDHNEDAYLVDLDLGLLVVADGVGGHQAGEIASAITCETIAREVAAGASLDQSILAANKAVRDAVDMGQGRGGMASTAVALLLERSNYTLAWVGDSRAYRWDGQELQLLTRDHSLVEILLSRGNITVEEARHHPKRNVVVRAIGSQANLQVDQKYGSLSPGEMLILCSDGLSDVLDTTAIITILGSSPNLQACSTRLVNTAFAQGGSDNITVVLCQAPHDSLSGSTVIPA